MDRKYEETIEHVTAAVAHATEESRRHHAEQTRRVPRAPRRPKAPERGR
jgi:hypothetical protein